MTAQAWGIVVTLALGALLAYVLWDVAGEVRKAYKDYQQERRKK